MPRTADPHPYLSRAILATALVVVLFWSWRVIGLVLEHVRGDVGP